MNLFILIILRPAQLKLLDAFLLLLQGPLTSLSLLFLDPVLNTHHDVIVRWIPLDLAELILEALHLYSFVRELIYPRVDRRFV